MHTPGGLALAKQTLFFEYIEKNRPQLLAYIGKNLSDSLKRKIEPEDILQEAAVSCLNAFDSIDFQKIDMFSWICQQCQRRIIDAHRHFFAAQKRDAAKEIGLNNAEPGRTAAGGLGNMIAASITSPSAAFSKQQKEFQLQNLIGQLSEDAQQVLKLRFVEGLATKEIAKRNGSYGCVCPCTANANCQEVAIGSWIGTPIRLMNQQSSDRDLKGWLNALLAFGWWGFVFPLVVLWAKYEGRNEIGSIVRWSFELLSLRILFCFLFCVFLLWLTEKLGLWLDVFRHRKILLGFALSSLLIFLNWLGFIIGASTNNISQASLGYYMGPLLNVFLGYIFLSEKLRRPQFVAVAVAGIGVAWLTYKAGEFPWIAMCLASSFGFYGLVRKRLQVDSVVGMTMECLFCLPLCLGLIVVFLWQADGLVFLKSTTTLRWIVILTGPATAIPLICFAIAAQRLRLGTLGFIQFIAPTGQLMLAMIYDKQPITGEKLIGYGFVWVAVGIYLVDLWRYQRRIAENG